MSDVVNQNKGNTGTPERNEGHRFETIYNGTIDNFGRHLLGRLITLELINNKSITGKLISFGQYDVVILDGRTGQKIIVMKQSIMTVQGDIDPKKVG